MAKRENGQDCLPKGNKAAIAVVLLSIILLAFIGIMLHRSPIYRKLTGSWNLIQMKTSSKCCLMAYSVKFIDQNDIVLLSITQKLDRNHPCFILDEQQMKNITELDLHRGCVEIIKRDSVIRRFRIVGIYDSELYDYSKDMFLCDGKGNIKLEDNTICVNEGKDTATYDN